MSKLYTVILLDNFNNIFASQSISPGNHYKGRYYGYPFFEMGKDDGGDSLVFFENERDALERAARYESAGTPAFVLGIKEECLEGRDWSDDDQYWRMAHPVIFPPFPTRDEIKVIFLSIDDKQRAINASLRSIETKFVDSLEKHFGLCESKSIIPGQSVLNMVEADTEVAEEGKTAVSDLPNEKAAAGSIAAENKDCIVGDKVLQEDADYFARMDKVRGVSFCYSIGSKSSAPTGDVRKELKSYIKELTSMINAVTQVEAYDELNRKKSALEASLFNLFLMCRPRVEEEDKDCFSANLIRNDVRRFIIIEYPEDLGSLKSSQSDLGKFEDELAQRPWELINLKRRNVRAYARFRVLEESSGEKAISVKLPAKEPELVNRFLAKLINSDACQGALRATGQNEDGRYLFLLECGKAIRDIIIESSGEKGWKESPERGFINALQTYLKKNEAFEFETHPEMDSSIVEMLYAIKTVCDIAGSDRSLDNFYRTLLKQGFVDFAVSFAIWGAVFGFSAMPKTMSDNIDKNAQKEIRRELKPVIEDLGRDLAKRTAPDEVMA